MFRVIFRTFAKLLVISATSFFIAGMFATGMACFMLTWPFIWGRPARRRTRSAVEMVTAIMAFASTLSTPGDLRQMVNVATSVVDGMPESDT